MIEYKRVEIGVWRNWLAHSHGVRKVARSSRVTPTYMIKAVLLDIDGVLVDSFDANHKFMNDLLVKAGYAGLPRETSRKYFHATMMDIIRMVTKSTSDAEVQRIWDMGNTRKVKYPLHLVTMPKDVPDTIARLSEKYTLGLVTSRIRNGVFEYPKLAALQNYFSVNVAYEDTANHKPHPEPLLFAAKQLGFSPGECVYVGDLETDLQAAKAAGMKCIICSKDFFDTADGYIQTFGGLPGEITNLNG